MHHDIDLIVRQSEQEVRLDDLERLVGQRGAVHGNLVAHAPGRMRERVIDGGERHLLARLGAEGATGGGEHHATDLVHRRRRLEALEERVVLAVDRNDANVGLGGGRHDHRAGGDERLLVRERDVAAPLDGDKRRADACGAGRFAYAGR